MLNCSPCLSPAGPLSEGILYERVLRRSGRVVLALADPRMAAHLRAHSWTAAAHGSGELHTKAGAGSGRALLRDLTARECLLGGRPLPRGLANVVHKDGCPANCLAGNLELAPRRGARRALQRFLEGVPQDGSGSVGSSGACTDAASAHDAARAALRQLYGAVGAERGREVLAQLHEEYVAAEGQP